MLQISKLGKELPLSPVRKLVPLADAAKARGIYVYHLNIGQPDIKTPDNVMNALRKFEAKTLEYKNSVGEPAYRQKLAQFYKKYRENIAPADIIATLGASEALAFIFMACFNEGDEIVVPEPFYANYTALAMLAGVKLIPITSRIEDNFALPAVNQFTSKFTDKTKGILICSPSNPTGYIYSEGEIKEIVKLAKEHCLYLIADEAYRDFTYDENEPFSLLSIEGIEENLLLVDSVSKRYSMCGARIGTIISKNTEVIKTITKFAQARLSPPAIEIYLAEEALNTPESYFKEVKAEYRNRRDYVVGRLEKMQGVVTSHPKGAFYLMVKLPVDDIEKFCSWLLESFEFEKETLMLATGPGFYATQGLGTNEARLAYVLEIEKLKRAMDLLEKALAQYPGRVGV